MAGNVQGGRDLRKRNENEITIDDLRMGHLEIGVVNDEVAVHQQVQVNDAGTPALTVTFTPLSGLD